MATLRPAMEDARSFTSYRTSSEYNEILKDMYSQDDAARYRYFLQDDGVEVVNAIRRFDDSGIPPKRRRPQTFPKNKPMASDLARSNRPL